ncbi:hypothetical protein IQ266_14065 [filamentous cyanobacterium LEGE 11480]|uniref:Uncharacterized protein n=1 Tax=Romeriopsis navalis LEGE 11480 TaxID=2777977 RepID=A0A928Z4B4_9CYAN|nr:hypothetical protein [Romeriopsis navalis]MBE9030857.1 hypothetical protein [Romeriopsis navalis LEGE 11480]
MLLRRFSYGVGLGLLAGLTMTPIAQANEVSAKPQSQTVVRRAGAIKAELSFDVVAKPWTQYKNVQLKVQRGDKTAYDRPLLDDAATKGLKDFWVMADRKFKGLANNSFLIRDLDGDQEPEIILEFYSGGAHCCVSSAIYRYDAAAKSYKPTVLGWGDAAATFELRQLDPQRQALQLVSRDVGFAYAFTAYAFSGYPVQIWEYQQGKIVDVTRRYPKLIYNSAYRNWLQIQRTQKDYPNEPQYARGPIAAYMATKYLLGQEKAGWALMDQVYRGSDKATFFADLRQFLIKRGYAKS